MTGIMEKWPSGYGQPTKSGYRTVAEGKPLQWRRIWVMIAMDLKAIWGMSVTMAATIRYSRSEYGGYLGNVGEDVPELRIIDQEL